MIYYPRGADALRSSSVADQNAQTEFISVEQETESFERSEERICFFRNALSNVNSVLRTEFTLYSINNEHSELLIEILDEKIFINYNASVESRERGCADENDLSAEEEATQQGTRLQKKNEHEKRTQGAAAKAQEGKKGFIRIKPRRLYGPRNERSVAGAGFIKFSPPSGESF